MTLFFFNQGKLILNIIYKVFLIFFGLMSLSDSLLLLGYGLVDQ